MESEVSFCGPQPNFKCAKVSTIVELCLSVIMNIGVLICFILFPFSPVVLFGCLNFILISTNTILVILELKSILGESIKKWNLVTRIILTVVAGLIVMLYLILMYYKYGDGREYQFSGALFGTGLAIVGPMFLYGIFKSFILYKMLKNQSIVTQQL